MTDTQSQYPLPPYPQYPVPPTNGKAVASMVLGILALIFAWCFGLSVVLGIIAICLAVASNRENVSLGRPKSGMSTAGLVCGILGTIFGAFWLVIIIAAAASSGS